MATPSGSGTVVGGGGNNNGSGSGGSGDGKAPTPPASLINSDLGKITNLVVLWSRHDYLNAKSIRSADEEKELLMLKTEMSVRMSKSDSTSKLAEQLAAMREQMSVLSDDEVKKRELTRSASFACPEAAALAGLIATFQSIFNNTLAHPDLSAHAKGSTSLMALARWVNSTLEKQMIEARNRDSTHFFSPAVRSLTDSIRTCPVPELKTELERVSVPPVTFLDGMVPSAKLDFDKVKSKWFGNLLMGGLCSLNWTADALCFVALARRCNETNFWQEP